jgi:oxalate---CoA ligase
VAPGLPPWSYGELLRHVEVTERAVRAAGIGPDGTVAVVLPNGPEMAAAFLGVASAARCAPLDPGSTRAEVVDALTDLGAGAVVVAEGVAGPAREAATALGVVALELSSETAGPPVVAGPRPGPDDIALLLRTSGTTARPKQVPLTHANLLTSAANVARTLALTDEDRCLNLMPLFHIHGLVACLTATLWAGGPIVCTPGFDRERILAWVQEARPTWYSAVPTIHQAMVAAAGDGRDWGLRFIRSSSAPLPPQLLARLEETFAAPVVEAYGMTEAAHQIASNPLPPGVRKPGTVGLPAGPEVTVLDGEICIRGPNVTVGYLDNPEANAAAFTDDGWLRTGDQGAFDEDGYLTITGRLKELINRGGEKIAPREVEEVLLDHDAVAEAIAFAVPHPTLGEDVAAAVVLRADADPTELRRFAGRRLGAHKVPRRLVVVDALPRGRTGKLQRRGLAEALGLAGGPAPAAGKASSGSAVEAALAGLWTAVLGVEGVEPGDDFFVLGGDSLSALELAEHVREVFGVVLTSEVLAGEAATLAGMARFVDASRGRSLRPVKGRELWRPTGRRRRAPLRRPPAGFVPTLTERWHGGLRLIADDGADALGIFLAFSDRSGGVSRPPFDSLNLSLQRGDSPDAVLENRRRLAAAVGFNPYSLAVSRPVFGPDVVEVGRRERGMVGDGDAIVARSSGPTLGLFHADCALVVVVGGGGVALAHVAADNLAALPGRVAAAVAPAWAAWIGPSVRGCCHEIDVPTEAAAALRTAGVPQVAVWPDCTSCDERYFSRRRVRTTGRQGAFVGIRADATPWERVRDITARGLRRVGPSN